jgi:hypothetical protein
LCVKGYFFAKMCIFVAVKEFLFCSVHHNF